jgi:hypothetical protein
MELVSQLPEIPPWKRLLTAFRAHGWKDNEIVPHEWLYEHMEVDIPDDDTPFKEAKAAGFKFWGHFNYFRGMLLEEDQIDLENVRSQGWRIIPPGEQARTAWEDGVGDMERAIERMQARMRNVRRSLLNADEKRELNDYQAKTAMLRGGVRGLIGYNDVELLEAKS